jgi:hypothetical protein
MMMSAAPEASTSNDRYFLVLGAAALDLWSHLPQELQETLFERGPSRPQKRARRKPSGAIGEIPARPPSSNPGLKHDSEKPAPDAIRDGIRLSEKIVRKQMARAG